MPNVARALQVLALILLLAAGTLILLISLGAFDPRPLGREAEPLFSGRLSVDAGQRRTEWLTDTLLPPPYSVHMQMSQQMGDSDAGLAVGGPEGAFIVAVSPLGYAAIWQGEPERLTPPAASIFPWQPWPHVRPDQNEIWLDVAPDQVTVYVNRELLWQGAVEVGGRPGLTVAAYDMNTVVRFEHVFLWR